MGRLCLICKPQILAQLSAASVGLLFVAVLLFGGPVALPSLEIRCHPWCTLHTCRWSKSVPSVGGAVTQDESCPALTHAIVPAAAPPAGGTKGSCKVDSNNSSAGGWASLPACLRPDTACAPAAVCYVTQAWLSDCLRFQRRQPESEYRPPPATPSAGATATAAATHATGAATTKGSRRRGGYTSGGGSSDEAGSDEENGGGGSGAGDSASLPRWLGPFWREECLEMEKAELMLQVGLGAAVTVSAAPAAGAVVNEGCAGSTAQRRQGWCRMVARHEDSVHSFGGRYIPLAFSPVYFLIPSWLPPCVLPAYPPPLPWVLAGRLRRAAVPAHWERAGGAS